MTQLPLGAGAPTALQLLLLLVPPALRVMGQARNKTRTQNSARMSADLETPLVHGHLLLLIVLKRGLFEIDQAVPELGHLVQRVRFALEPAEWNQNRTQ